MKRIGFVATIIILLLSFTNVYAEQTSLDHVSFEVKFLLEPDLVLTSEHLLTGMIKDRFSIESEYTPIDVIFLETADRSFSSEGWVNRIRWKGGKKKPERTYKKRYPVNGCDQVSILEALEKVASDGIDTLSDDCAVEIDWGYSKMTLSVTWEASGKYNDCQNLRQFNTQDAITFFALKMPEEEANWKRPGWGIEMLSHAQKVGITTFLRVKGSWEETEVAFEIAAIPAGDTTDYIVEL